MSVMSARAMNGPTTFPDKVAAASAAAGQSGGDSASPLQRFVRAKLHIGAVYKELFAYVNRVYNFLQSAAERDDKDPPGCEEDAMSAPLEQVKKHLAKVEGIQAVLGRDHMKVVFFGRTSNGKSTVINSLLGEHILPMGIGHTTSCFLQVEGGPEADAFLLTEDSQEHKSVQSVSQLGNALCAEKLQPSAKVRIVWPRFKCKMLDEEVVLIDSPGIDVETDLDEWIDKFCLDSDVFVLVANSESTLMLTEKRFFHKVSERLSKPNIFIVHNRSDAFAGDETESQVRLQHTQRAVQFLVEELKVCSCTETALGRVFFISAKEALRTRALQGQGQPGYVGTEGYDARYQEFLSFEQQFSDCLSKAAVRTKFAQHSIRGLQIVRDVRQLLCSMLDHSDRLQQESRTLKKNLSDQYEWILRQLDQITVDMKDKIRCITEDVEFKVGKAMSEEIRRLSVLVDDFSDSFHPDPLVLNVYKNRLNNHIENCIGSNLKSRLSPDLQLNMEWHEKEMIERMVNLLPADKKHLCRNVLPRRDPFEVLYHLHFDNLCADFQEDIKFRFSLGLGPILSRLMAAGRSMSLLSTSSSPPPRAGKEAFGHAAATDDWSLVSKVALASLTSHGTMAGLIVGGLLFKTVGWRVILVTGGMYGALYLYQKLTWTNQAMCREFKRQYVEHAARKMRLVVDMTSANCSHQVQQELSSTFARLCHLVDETTDDIQSSLQRIDTNLKHLETVAHQSKALSGQAALIETKFNDFDHLYLVDH